MNRLLIVLFAALVTFPVGCSDNPAGPGNIDKGFAVSTDASSYSTGSSVTVTIKNGSGKAGLFSMCGSMWDFILQAKTGDGWTNRGALNCLAIYMWTVATLAPDSSHSVVFPGQLFAGSSDSTVTYRFRFRFGVAPDNSLSDSLFSNSFEVSPTGG